MHNAGYDRIVAEWQLGPPQQIVIPDSGTVNTIVKVTLDGREYFLRAYRHHDRAPREHEVIAHARAHNFPAVTPVPLPAVTPCSIETVNVMPSSHTQQGDSVCGTR